MLRELIYKMGAVLRNPSLRSHYEFLLESDRWSLDRLKAYQLERLRELLQFAYAYSPYYHTLFDKIRFDPAQMRSLDDLKAIPPMDKQTLIARNGEIHTAYRFRRLRLSETSGTSGAALKFYRNEEWDSAHRAAMFRGYSWYGVRPWEKNGYFWGYNIASGQRWKVRALDFLQNRFRIFSYNADEIAAFIRKLQNGAVFVSGYSSMIYEVAKQINRTGGRADLHLKMVKGTSEKIYDSYQQEAQQAFGRKIISEYGSAEAGIIAYECPEGGHMHIVMEHVIVEEIDGEIVVTNLLSRSFPIIRYKLGDMIRLAPEDFRCPCGRAHPVILDVLGRVGKRVVGKRGSYPSLTFYYVFKNLGLNENVVLNYQAVQQEPGRITLRIEQNCPEYSRAVGRELAKYFGDDLEFTILWGEKLHKMDGKLRDFVTTLE